MIRNSVIRNSRVFLFTLVVILSLTNIVCQAQSQTLLTRHVREAVLNGEAQSVGRLPATQSLRFDIVLALRHQPELEDFLQELYDPSSPIYRQFLTVQEFTERFGPSQEDYDALIAFAKASGFTLVAGSRDAMDVQLKAPVANIERAFHVTMRLYQHPTENRTFYAPDREPTVDLPIRLWHVSGLDNYSIPRAALRHSDLTVQSNTAKGSCPLDSYCGSDMRAAYYGGTALTAPARPSDCSSLADTISSTSMLTSRTLAKPTRCPSMPSPPTEPPWHASILRETVTTGSRSSI